MATSRSQVQKLFQYIAYGKNQEVIRGRLLATSEDAVVELLGYDGFKVINVKQISSALGLGRLGLGAPKVKATEVVLLYRQLALLLESGINMVTALDMLREQISNRTLKDVISEVTTDLRAGSQLSSALARHPKIFSPIYCRSLSVGEQVGGLEVILRQIAEYMEKESQSVKKTKGALTYPVIALVMTVAVVGLMVTFVLPAFGGLYTSLGVELPTMVKLLLSLSDIMKHYGIYMLIVLLAAVMALYSYIKTPAGRYKLDKLLLQIPLLGHVTHLSELARICKSIALLYRAGLPLTDIMVLVIEGTNNKVIAEALTGIQQDMLKGEGLSQPMERNPIFLPMMVQMVKVGEETGNLDVNLSAVVQSFETEVEDRTRSLIALIQPVTTVIIGGVVGLVAMSLMSAMYSMYGQMQ